jgi:4-alpha-glucanotransferase
MPNLSDDGAAAVPPAPDAVTPVQATAARPLTVARPILDEASELWGIEREFLDIWGERHETPPETAKAVLKSLGVDASNPAHLERAIDDRLWREWSRPLAPTIVIGDRPPIEIPVQLPADLQSPTACLEIHFENGISSRFDLPLASSPVIGEATVRGRHFVRKRLEWPDEIPLGYHNVTLRIGQEIACDARLIAGPGRAWQPHWLEPRRTAGIGVSLYALRSSRNWGCGDFTDLHALIDWAARELSVTFVGLNPLHAIPNRQPFNTSPYLPNCSYYRNPIYLDIEKIDDFSRSPWAQRMLASDRLRAEIEALRASGFIEYERVHRLKTRFLKILFRRFLLLEFPHETARAREFRSYIEREGDLLHRFAVHSALDETIHKRDRNIWNWPSWPEPYRKPDSPATAEFAERHWRSVLYHKYVQWQIDLQLEATQKYARKRGLRIGLYHDLALAVDRFGCDLWSHRHLYVSGCRVGSPPDKFAPKGQDWAFPPPNSGQHFIDAYQLFAESVRKNCRHGGALRIDHVMRFFRLYWIPDGMDATQGTYVRDRFEDLLQIVALESVRNMVLVVGEDLGTVPDSVRETLARFGILSYRLFYFEQDKDGRFRKPAEYPRQALVSITTHDLPTLAGFWSGRDIEARRSAGLLPGDGAYRRMLEDRAHDKQKMLDLLFDGEHLPAWFPRNARDVPELTGELHNAVVGFLASTPSMMLLLNMEDIFKETQQQNLPGTTAEYPNWRRKMRYSIEELPANEFTRNCTQMVRNWIDRSGRSRLP